MTSLADLDWPWPAGRLALRPAQAADAGEIWAWHGDPAVNQWLPSQPADEPAFTTRFTAHLGVTLVAVLDGRIVGSAKVQLADAWSQVEVAHLARGQQCEIGWVLDPALHRRGLGTELARGLLGVAFDGLDVHRVVAVCFADNVASWKTMARIGMRHEATFRAESLHRSGRWLDAMTWAMLSEEWRGLHA